MPECSSEMFLMMRGSSVEYSFTMAFLILVWLLAVLGKSQVRSLYKYLFARHDNTSVCPSTGALFKLIDNPFGISVKNQSILLVHRKSEKKDINSRI